MSKLSTDCRRRTFEKAGLNGDLFEQIVAECGELISQYEPAARKYIENPKKLKEVFIMASDVWSETVFTKTPPAGEGLPELIVQAKQSDIPYEELYSIPGYLVALYECWYNWTVRSTASAIIFLNAHPELQNDAIFVADGIGLGALMYAKAFPNNKVYCHIMGGDQKISIAKALATKFGATNMEVVTELKQVPIVIAFETFEHFYDPIKFATDAVGDAKVLIHASPWAVEAHGHFKYYLMEGREVPNTDVARIFGKWIKSLGFVSSSKTYNFKFFNERPTIYTR